MRRTVPSMADGGEARAARPHQALQTAPRLHQGTQSSFFGGGMSRFANIAKARRKNLFLGKQSAFVSYGCNIPFIELFNDLAPPGRQAAVTGKQ
jgi:hypothetical protein